MQMARAKKRPPMTYWDKLQRQEHNPYFSVIKHRYRRQETYTSTDCHALIYD